MSRRKRGFMANAAVSGSHWLYPTRRALHLEGGLLDGLMVRAGVTAPPPPKPKRGRPRSVVKVAAEVWSDVTGGRGVLIDPQTGEEVDPKAP